MVTNDLEFRYRGGWPACTATEMRILFEQVFDVGATRRFIETYYQSPPDVARLAGEMGLSRMAIADFRSPRRKFDMMLERLRRLGNPNGYFRKSSDIDG